MSIWDQLNKYEEAFQKAEVKEDTGGFQKLPDGRYKVKINRAAVEENKNSGNPQMKWEFIVVEGNYEGRCIWRVSQLDAAERVGWLKQDLYNLGYKLESLTELKSTLEKTIDQIIEVNLKTKGEHQNVYINSVNVDAPVEQEKAGRAPLKDDDLPF